eukprot:Skav216429  [mRNA]  locus=scaffold3139:292499:305530:- [translate_table: standard]
MFLQRRPHVSKHMTSAGSTALVNAMHLAIGRCKVFQESLEGATEAGAEVPKMFGRAQRPKKLAKEECTKLFFEILPFQPCRKGWGTSLAGSCYARGTVAQGGKAIAVVWSIHSCVVAQELSAMSWMRQGPRLIELPAAAFKELVKFQPDSEAVTFDLFRAAGGKVVAELNPEERWGIVSVDGWELGQPGPGHQWRPHRGVKLKLEELSKWVVVLGLKIAGVLRQERQQMRQQLRLSKRMERVVPPAELRLLEADTEALRGKLPLRREALVEARRKGQVLRAAEVDRAAGRSRGVASEEAELDERCSSMTRRKEELELREQRSLEFSRPPK